MQTSTDKIELTDQSKSTRPEKNVATLERYIMGSRNVNVRMCVHFTFPDIKYLSEASKISNC